MTNWKEIHPEFTENLVKKWTDKGFTYEQVKNFANIWGDKFDINSYDLFDQDREKLKKEQWKSEEVKEVIVSEIDLTSSSILKSDQITEVWASEEVNLTSNSCSPILEKKEENLETPKLSDEVVKKIENFEHTYKHWISLTSEQEILIEKLITDEELKKRYKKCGLCSRCRQPNTDLSRISEGWCQSCNAFCFQLEFKNWTSDDHQIDKFIQKHQLIATNHNQILEWIPYEKFTDIEYLAEGGFGKVYKAKWTDGQIWNWNIINNTWERYGSQNIVFKVLNNSENMTTDFLREITNYKLATNDIWNFNVVGCHGISRDPETKNYLMVMDYIEGGDLRKYLLNNRLSFKDKFFQLQAIAGGLKEIHQEGLIHKDFHPGNILIDYVCYITDLGLCRPANEVDENKIYGVIPYMAPEVLRGGVYTQASDIYSFGIVAYELFTNSYPYPKMDDMILTLEVCDKLRPNIDKFLLPQLLKDLIKRCWDSDPTQRPTASQLDEILLDWKENTNREEKEYIEFHNQLKESKEEYNQISKNFSYKNHSVFNMTSKSINTRQINELLENSERTVVDNFEQEVYELEEYESMRIKTNSVEIESDLCEQRPQIQQPPKK